VLPVVSRGAFDEGSCIEDAEPSLAESFRFPDHLSVEIWVKFISATVPRHHEDDVPNVGSGGQLNQIIEGAEVHVDTLLIETFLTDSMHETLAGVRDK